MSLHPTNIPTEVEKLGRSLTLIVDVLIPGGDGWPAASSVGVQHSMLMRLLDNGGDTALASLSDLLGKYGFDERRSACEEIKAVARLETEEPQSFIWLRTVANYAYYEAPSIVSLIDRKGTPYRLMPHRDGYELAPFNEATQSPRHGRGKWVPTDEVKAVDITGLELQTRKTEKWGLDR